MAALEPDISIQPIKRATTLPPFYMELNTEWVAQLQSDFPTLPEIPKDLILTERYDILFPDFGSLEEELQTDIFDLFVTVYMPKIEKTKETFEYKELLINELLEGSEKILNIEIGKVGNTIQIDNLVKIERTIRNEPDLEKKRTLSTVLQDIQNEMNILNGIRPTLYDIILYLNLHGVYQPHFIDPEDDGLDDGLKLDDEGNPEKGVFPICRLYDPDKNVTMLSATSPGITHILNPEQLSTNIEQAIKTQYDITSQLDMEELQESIRKLKKDYIQLLKSSGADKLLMIRYGTEMWNNFKHDAGWRISKNKWLNKHLIKDDKFGWPIKIFKDEKKRVPMDIFDRLVNRRGKTHMSTKLTPHPNIYTDDIIQYLLELGYTNILIIDASCGDQSKYKGRYRRRLSRWAAKEKVNGGKRSKTKKTKKRKTKRKTKRI